LIAQDEISKFIHSQETTPIKEPEPILIQNPVAVRVIPEPSKPQSSGSVYQDPRYIPQKAYDYSQRGYKDQINFMNELIDNGFEVLEHHETEKSLPDIVALYKGEYFIYQFKSWQCDIRKEKAKCNSRTLRRENCKAEIERAYQLKREGRKVHLVIAFYNPLNNFYEVKEVNLDHFSKYSTSSRFGEVS
jgi:Holliday junction resolvase